MYHGLTVVLILFTIVGAVEADDGQKVVCWGADFAGQSTVPVNLANGVGNKHIVGISVGWEHSCAASLEVSQT